VTGFESFPDYRCVGATRTAVQSIPFGARGAPPRQDRGIFDHNAVGVNSLQRPAIDRKMLRNACGKKDIILFYNPVPFPVRAAYIRCIPPLIHTRT
jgi:hypothetical protein